MQNHRISSPSTPPIGTAGNQQDNEMREGGGRGGREGGERGAIEDLQIQDF